MKKTKLITSLTVASALVMGSVVPAFAYSKEETVYIKLKTNGTEKTTVVSQHLINDQKETILEYEWKRNIQTKRRNHYLANK